MAISNAEARYNKEKNTWEYFSTAEGEKGQYVVSVRPNSQGEFEFFNYAETLDMVAHPELGVDASAAEILARMQETGIPKAMFVRRETVSKLIVKRYPAFGNNPGGLITVFKGYPSEVLYPYSTRGQANPLTPSAGIGLMDINIEKDKGLLRFIVIIKRMRTAI